MGLDSLPQELLDLIIDFLRDDLRSLHASALVCRAWVPSARAHLTLAVSTRNCEAMCDILSSPLTTIPPQIKALRLGLYPPNSPLLSSPFLPAIFEYIQHIQGALILEGIASWGNNAPNNINFSVFQLPCVGRWQFTGLEIHHIGNINDASVLTSIITQSSSLRYLSLAGVFGGGTVVSRDPLSAPLEEIYLSGECRNILAWLTSQPCASSIKTAYLDGISFNETNRTTIQGFIDSSGQTLEKLTVTMERRGFSASRPPFSFGHCTALKNLTLSIIISANPQSGIVRDTIRTLATTTLETLTVHIDSDISVLERLNWRDTDSFLASQKLLREVVIAPRGALRGPGGRESESHIRKRLRRCSIKGILRLW